jgi:hypothetical protein
MSTKKPVSRLTGRNATDGKFTTVEWARIHKDNARGGAIAVTEASAQA